MASRYRGRLAVGIVAGMISGGSVFGLLRFVPEAVRPLEASSQQVVAAAEPGLPAPEPDPAAAPPAAADATTELSSVHKAAETLGIQPTGADGRMTWEFFLLSVVGLPLFAILWGLSKFLNSYSMRWVAARLVADLREGLFENLQRQSLRFFAGTNTGQLISRCNNDTAIIEGTVAQSVADLVRAPSEVAGALVFVFLSARDNGLLGLTGVALLVFPLCIIPIIILGKRVRAHTSQALNRISDLTSRMHENFSGVRVVKAFHTEQREVERFRDMNGHYFRSMVGAVRAELCMTPLMEVVGAVTICGFLVYCFAVEIRLHQILPVVLAAVIAYKPLKQIARLNAALQRCTAAASRVFELLDTDMALPEAENPVRVAEFAHSLVFENVSFRYTEEGGDVLRDLSFEVPRGSVVAFVGETGSGKTTAVNLVARFYDPTAGRVLLDGRDLRELEIASLRALIGVVTQETVLFNETIANNIAYGVPDASRERIEAAARQANAHEFIAEHPHGYERVVGERGFVLSGGQRQRIAIARAILRNPPILILDEATSSLDTVTEQLVQEAINRAMENRTVFAVAHRLSTVKHADQILVLQNGAIAERGSHGKLLAAGGLYTRLHDMQFS